jgi:branched-chain amino acid aminotransferase
MPDEPLVYLNGRFLPESEATISIYDRGFLYGDLVTESTRTFGLRPFRLREHVERLGWSLRATEIAPGLSLDEIERITLELLERNRALFGQHDDAWIVHNVSRGVGAFGRGPGEQERRATVLIHCFPIDFRDLARRYREGVHAVVPSTRQLPPECLDPKIKHRSRMHFALAGREAARVEPGAQPVLLDLRGNLTEGPGANFFLVSRGVVRTPGSHGVLRGISRATVFELCRQLGIACREEDLQPYDAVTAEEAFFTSTPYCLLPVTRFNGQPLGDGGPGPITRRLLEAWSALVGTDIVAQAERSASATPAGAGGPR